MKRILILALSLMLLVSSAALAQTPVEMKVVNCDEWVSLRAEPDATAQRFAEVKLGETVRGFYESNGEFTHCEYDGVVGYIMTKYLEVQPGTENVFSHGEIEPDGELPLENGSVRFWKEMGDYSERLTLAGCDAEGKVIWSYATESLGTTELDAVACFVNDKAARPMVMVYNSYYGLIALNAETGAEIWTLPVSRASLGGSIRYALAENGTMYIGGYYGPDPKAISADGQLLWEAEQTDTDFYWISDITVEEGGICVRYDNGDAPVLAHFDAHGTMTAHEPAA